MKLNQMMTVGLILILSLQAYAAEFCATNAASLHTILAIAEANNEDDVVRIRAGFFDANGTTFSYEAANNWDLDISGGWGPTVSGACGIQSGGVTTLDGQTAVRVLNIIMSGDAKLTVSDLNFVNGLTSSDGGGLSISRVGSLVGGKVTVERNIFINNSSVDGSSALMILEGDTINVQNNLFTANQTGDKYTIHIVQSAGYGSYFVNNTVIFNDASVALGDEAGVRLSIAIDTSALVANNVMQENGNEDLFLFGGGDFYLKTNNVGAVNGAEPFDGFGNFNLPPRFESGLLDFTPTATSPLVNAGISPCFVCPIDPPFDQTWQLGDVDLGGNDRVQNGRPDIGAYESPHIGDLIFWDIFGG